VFSSVSQTVPVRSRAWGIGLGTIIMVGVPIMIMSAKTVQITLPLLLVGACAGAYARGRLAQLKPRPGAASLALAAFILYAALSALWAPDPLAVICNSLLAAVVLVGSLVLTEALRTENRADALHMGEGLWIGLLVGMLYMIAEAASDQAIKIWAYNFIGLGPDALMPARYYTWENGRLIAVHPDDLTRNIVPAPLLLWPALMAATGLASRYWRTAVIVLLLAMSGAAVMLATSETAKLALVAGIAVFALTRLSAPVAKYALSGAWIVACLGVVPAVYLARYYELQDADWLQLSAQLRITLWNQIAQLVSKAPIFGVGADMTYFIRPKMQEAPAAVASWAGTIPITHPHNVYLQTWYELGFVGASILTVFGLMLLGCAARLDKPVRPFAFAMFAAGAVQIAFSYSMWQIWFVCLFGFAVAMFALGEGLLEQANLKGG
jgi:O-antigen ligase